VSNNLVISKRSFDVSLYEMDLVYTNQDVEKYLNEIQMSQEESVLTTYYTNDNIILDSKLITFKDFIFGHVYVFCKNVLNKEKFDVRNSWFQTYKKENYHTVHVHNCNEYSYSLIFYVKASESSSNTRFYLPGFPYTPAKMIDVQAKQNRLVIFPGYIPHQVPPNKDEERIIFSANFEVLD
tara:strand:+ start:1096 stop:1638 length:543 start_codon:yes stop_codon:yes gene_type:complete